MGVTLRNQMVIRMIKTKSTILSENFFRRFADVFSPFIASAGIDPRVVELADIEIPEDRYVALWEAVGREKPNIGLEIGSQTEPEDLGAMGHALHCAPSVPMALETLQRFIVVLSQSSLIGFEAGGAQLTIDYQAADPTIVYRRQDAEFAIAVILRQLQLITDERLLPIRVDFEHDKPTELSVHKTLFQCPIFFNQPINRLYFSPDLLDFPVKQGNERLYQALKPYLERQREARTESDELLPRITRIIAADLSSGVPPLAAVSDQLGMGAVPCSVG